MAAKITIVGNLGGDPEMRYTPAGKAVTNISVATNRKYKKADGTEVEETTWFRLSFWEKSAETVNQWFKKGMPIYIEGRLKFEPTVFERKNGEWASSYEVHVDRWEFISGGGNGGGSYAQSEQSSSVSGQEPKDIPF